MFFFLSIFHKGQCYGKHVMLIPNEPSSAQFSPQCVGPSVCEHESKSEKTSVLEAFLSMCLCWKEGWGGAFGVDGGWLPLPTRPQRYWDPASLVNISSCVMRFKLFIFIKVLRVKHHLIHLSFL